MSELGVRLTYCTGEITEVLTSLRSEIGIDTIWAHEEVLSTFSITAPNSM